MSDDILKHTNLRALDISGNQLKVLPEFLKELKYLEKLNISYNPLAKIPNWLWKLNDLKDLNISGLHLKNLPVEVGNLKQIEVLIINESAIKTLPESIGYLKKLKVLSLKNNELEKLPKTFSYLKSLEKINLRKNRFKVFPKTIFSFKNINYINVSVNSIKVVPKQIGTLQALKYLNISENNIREIPTSLYTLNLRKTHFHFKNNSLSRVALGEIKKMFERQPVKPIQGKEKETSSQKERLIVEEKKRRNKKSSSTLVKIITPILMFSLLSVFIFYKTGKGGNEKIVEKEIPKEKVLTYELAKEKQEERMQAMLEKTDRVFVYTNDTQNLDLTIRPNTMYNDQGLFRYDDASEATYIHDFLQNKSYGYNVHLNNSKEKIENVIKVYDSIIPNKFLKKFIVLAYYKMTPREKKCKRLTRNLR